MKVVLLKNVKSLGKVGDVKEVKDGYGKNFLIAKGLAKIATKDTMRILEANKQKQAQQEANRLQMYQDYKKTIEANQFTMPHKIAQNGSLYGAITKQEIAQFLATQDIAIDKKSIELKTPIKQAGVHTIDIKLGEGIHALLHLEIVSQ